MKKNFFKITTLLFLSLFLLGCSAKPEQQSEVSYTIPPGYFYFYSPTCEACVRVASYMQTNQVKRDFFFVEKNVDNSPESVNLLMLMVGSCRLPTSRISVPFFWDGQSCHVGEHEVIDRIEQELLKRRSQ